jgi:hypothetical protein
MADELTPTEDQPRQKPDLVREREWAHSPDGGLGRDCDKIGLPIYADPAVPPKPCTGRDQAGTQSCGSESWDSNGIVIRDRGNGRVVIREPKL